jgi:hypothetical protein
MHDLPCRFVEDDQMLVFEEDVEWKRLGLWPLTDASSRQVDQQLVAFCHAPRCAGCGGAVDEDRALGDEALNRRARESMFTREMAQQYAIDTYADIPAIDLYRA